MIVLLSNGDAECAIWTEILTIFQGGIEIMYPCEGDTERIEYLGGWPWRGVSYAACTIYADDEAYLIEDNYPDAVWFDDRYGLDDE